MFLKNLENFDKKQKIIYQKWIRIDKVIIIQIFMYIQYKYSKLSKYGKKNVLQSY